RIVGHFLGFIFFGVAISQCVYLIVLKAVQTGLMIAQYMFAPIFLVFFAVPDTEKVAAGFVKSCIEGRLWAFGWAGFLGIVVVILSSGEPNAWGDFIMLLGVLQIMLNVPGFIAKAQISPASDYLSTKGVMKGLSTLGKTLAEAGGNLKKWWQNRGKDETELN